MPLKMKISILSKLFLIGLSTVMFFSACSTHTLEVNHPGKLSDTYFSIGTSNKRGGQKMRDRIIGVYNTDRSTIIKVFDELEKQYINYNKLESYEGLRSMSELKRTCNIQVRGGVYGYNTSMRDYEYAMLRCMDRYEMQRQYKGSKVYKQYITNPKNKDIIRQLTIYNTITERGKKYPISLSLAARDENNGRFIIYMTITPSRYFKSHNVNYAINLNNKVVELLERYNAKFINVKSANIRRL